MKNELKGLNHYWLINAHVPVALLAINDLWNREFAFVDLEIKNGAIAQLIPAGTVHPPEIPSIDLKRGQVWSCFVDMHTHLDKGHIWERSPNLNGTFENALQTVQSDCKKNWKFEDVYRRMEFGLKCSYAHGTQAIRTHIDSADGQAEISLAVFKKLRQEWGDRLTLQAVSLVSLDYFLTPEGEKLADQMAEVKGILGGVLWMNDEVNTQLDRVFELAKERHLNLDFHTDESNNPNDITLRLVAEAALRHQFTGQIVCGHCCSLAVQSPAEAMKTIALVKQANIGVVSLPMCNLYLQDRQPSPRTPRWRGVTLLHELKQQGIPVAVASDNCRDPFYGFGDHDMHEVFTQAVRIAHLDAPYSDWCRTVTTTPADLMGLSIGRIGVGLPADLVLFKARHYSELLARSQHDRVVLRRGQPIDAQLPEYAELDDLVSSL
ncbi:MAG: cytosine deaminase [Timaviella obliquedivisa GSE-PSE-MK23-08B]|jgi:cytosine deaminase|nr:cytosine deaminase [Timaviella obliquedivisa GSE-PSE-MK23-08B]